MKNYTQPITVRELYEDLVKTFTERKVLGGMDEETARKKGNIYAVKNTWKLYNLFKAETSSCDEDSTYDMTHKSKLITEALEALNEMNVGVLYEA